MSRTAPKQKANSNQQLTDLLTTFQSVRQAEHYEGLGHAVQAILIPLTPSQESTRIAAHGLVLFQPQHFEQVLILAPTQSSSGFQSPKQNSLTTNIGSSPVLKIPTSYGVIASNETLQDETAPTEIITLLQARILEEELKLENYPIALLLYGDVNPEKLARKIDHFLTEHPRTFLVLASDLSHDHPSAEAEQLDTLSLEAIMNRELASQKKMQANGKTAILALLQSKFGRNLDPELLEYANSPLHEKALGQAAIAYLDPNQGQSKNASTVQTVSLEPNLAALAQDPSFRRDCLAYLRDCLVADADTDLNWLAKKYPQSNHPAATYVTLELGGKLRGSTGSLVASRSLCQDLSLNVIGAAYEDKRFPPVKAEELADLTFKVFILNRPQLLRSRSPYQLLAKIDPSKHGVIVVQGQKQAAFLPEAWKTCSNKIEFMNRLCQKAELDPDQWTRGKIGIFIFTGYEITL